jgi:hypothetical protein
MVGRMAGVLVGLKGEAVQGMPLTIAQVADNGRRGETSGMGCGRTDTRSRLERRRKYLEGRAMKGIQGRRRLV